jgi:hypothetical protein
MMPIRASIVGPPDVATSDQGLHRGLPFRRFVLGLWQLGDVRPGILECDELATAAAASRCLSAVQVAISTKRL